MQNEVSNVSITGCHFDVDPYNTAHTLKPYAAVCLNSDTANVSIVGCIAAASSTYTSGSALSGGSPVQAGNINF
jgi:hypothetical protein